MSCFYREDSMFLHENLVVLNCHQMAMNASQSSLFHGIFKQTIKVPCYFPEISVSFHVMLRYDFIVIIL